MIGLIGCEFSQVVTEAFRKQGHEFYSCDIIPCEGSHPEWHLQMDIFEAMELMEYDFIGLHPPCTKITLSGNRSYAPGKTRNNERIEAVEWTIKLWQTAIHKAKKVYMENPLGAMNSDPRLESPQLIQPYYFGDNVPKKTCLWLHGLPKLHYNHCDNLFGNKTLVDPEYVIYKSNHTKSGISKYSIFGTMPSTNNPGNAKKRCLFFPGIAQAMAEQWNF